MSQQTVSSTSRRPQRRSARLLVGAALSAGLLLVAAACGDKGGDSNGTGNSGGNDVKSAVDALQVCGLVDLTPLTTVTKSTWAEGPKDVPVGVGKDPGGPQCTAQMKLPDLHTGPSKAVVALPNGRFDSSVVAYGDVNEANTQFQSRVDMAKSAGGSTATDLTGNWTRGTLLSGTTATNYLYALVQKDNYLIRIEVTTPSDASYDEKYPFTADQVKQTVTELMTGMYTAVSGKVGSK